MSELRKDPVTGRWVIISTERRKRPTDFRLESVHNAPDPASSCTLMRLIRLSSCDQSVFRIVTVTN